MPATQSPLPCRCEIFCDKTKEFILCDIQYFTGLQLQALRLLQVILPTGLSDAKTYPIVIKKLFHLLGNIGLLCYPDLPLYNFGK